MANKTICALTYGDTHVFTLPYGTCSTAAATAAKTVAVQDGKFSLETGARVAIKFTVTNTATSPTLNVSGTGAKNIFYRGSAISAGYLAANRIYEFIYDGTNWELLGDVDTNTTTTTNSTNTSSKIFLIGATTQGSGKTTYSHDTAYVGTDGCLYSNNTKVSVYGHTHTAADIGAMPVYKHTTSLDFNSATAKQLGIHIIMASPVNGPCGNWGTLIVDANTGSPYQLYIPDGNTSVFYKRALSASSWQTIGYSYGTSDLTAGSSSLETGQLYFVYE